MNEPRFVIAFRDLGLADIPRVGGKNASLGELIARLTPLGVRVPDGFAVTADAFRAHLHEASLEGWIYGQLASLDISDTRALAETAARVRERIVTAPLPSPIRDQMLAAYAKLSGAETEGVAVAVRSSATAEDLPTASFAGQQETYLNIRGRDALDHAVRACMASLFTDRAIVYREQNNFDHRSVALSVGVQIMVRSDLACAGTMFTLDTETGFRGVVLIDASWGLGESIVQGRVSPDEYWVHKPTAKAGFRSIIRKELGDKAVKLIYASDGLATARSVQEVPVSDADRRRLALTDDEIMTLARWAVQIEDHYSAEHADGDVPMDLEWAKDGITGELFILQARPETVHSQRPATVPLEVFRVKNAPEPILTGKSIGSRVGAGPVRLVRSADDLQNFSQGEVLVSGMTDPDWEPVLRKAAAVITIEADAPATPPLSRER